MTKSQRKFTAYKNQFNRDRYDRLGIMVPKGQKSIINEHAEKHGEKINTFVNRAINETMANDNK